MKKIILSRKGFDSSAGCSASPIFEDGTIFSIPIPQRHKKDRNVIAQEKLTLLANVQKGKYSGADALKKVNSKLDSKVTFCHHDPLLTDGIGLFGQTGKVQTELSRHNVSIGDLFLFFGWFKDYSLPAKPNVHQIFGWLQIDEIISGTAAIREYCASRNVSHVHANIDYPNNTLYVGSKLLSMDENSQSVAGFGEFDKTRPELCLTESGKTRSNWQMPLEYFNEHQNPELFSNRLKWNGNNDNTLQCKGYGQEFVIDVEKNPTAKDWALNLIYSCAKNNSR